MSILIGLSAIADKIKLPYPVLLVLTGLVIGFVPVLPDLAMDPHVVFLIFLPPLLYDAASHTSWHDFRTAIRPISTLAITLVFFTTSSVAIAAHYYIPGFTWPLSFVLGAIVSPPDAVAATGITKGLGLNKKVITILEGESLVNDASALIAYRYAVAAVASGSFVLWVAGLQFLLVAGGGILAGAVVGFIFVFAHKKIHNNAIVETSLTLLSPFLAYSLAERFHTSGVLAVVCTGLLISWRAPEIFSSQTRLQTRAVWDTLIFLLNGIIFILIGLQLPGIIKALKGYSLMQLIGYGLIISAVTIFIRIIWVFAGAYHQTFLRRKASTLLVNEETVVTQTPWKNVLIVAWTGTRGVVSLATALALPLTMNDGTAFPQRNIILFLAFFVIFVTLVVQGLSLPLLIRWLGVTKQDDSAVEARELQLLMAKRVIDYLDNNFPLQLEERLVNQIKKRLEMVVSQATKQIDMYHQNNGKNNDDSASLKIPLSDLLSAQLEIAKFQRGLLLTYHKEGSFSDEIIRKMEQQLDIEDIRLSVLVERETMESAE